MTTLNLQEAILSAHEDATPPATYSRNSRDIPIDGVWISPTIQILQAGYTPFGSWDHRGAWIDVSNASVFGSHPPPQITISARRLQLNAPSTVHRYLQQYKQLVSQHKLADRIFALENTIQDNTPLTTAQQKEIKAIDTLQTKLMLQAEKHSRKLRVGALPFSPQLVQPAREKEYWRLVGRKLDGYRVSSRLLSRRRKMAGIQEPIAHLTKEDVHRRQKQAHQKWKAQKQKASKLRTSFLEERVTELISQGKLSRAKALQILHHRETLRRAYRRISQATKDPKGRGLQQVIGPGPNNERVHYTDERQMVNCCMRANKAKYLQSEPTPFLQEPLLSMCGYDGLAPGAQTILKGHYKPQHRVHHLTNAYIQQLPTPSHLPNWSHRHLYISTASHQQAWRKAKERTSSSPSGLHFGLWKANARIEQLAEMDAAMRYIPYTSGYSLQR